MSEYVDRREGCNRAIGDIAKDGIRKVAVGVIVLGVIGIILAIGTFFAVGSLFRRGSDS